MGNMADVEKNGQGWVGLKRVEQERKSDFGGIWRFFLCRRALYGESRMCV